MAKLKIGGRELRAVNLSTARNRDIMQLQTESGMRMKQIAEIGKTNDTFAMLVVSYLTQHNAGLFVKWDDLLDASLDELGAYVKEPGDERDEPEKAEGEEVTDPTQADSATSAPDAPSPSLPATD
ncbi:hypothetical protein QN354_02165 [Cryobacterium sp. 5I3]|uniref:hypothetical protein n=1 Tax=Cryobacterium sp. 5I3 TaxID=3048592 RepID=UPI002B23314C|nr:hypothetical protein [Cryobacterium sp. 5I3]MEB0200559.1 hypothetical protein [Cryobacterium sp. 5I3]